MSGQEVGKISKQWSGFVREMFTQADNFGVSCELLFKLKLNQYAYGDEVVKMYHFYCFEQFSD